MFNINNSQIKLLQYSQSSGLTKIAFLVSLATLTDTLEALFFQAFCTKEALDEQITFSIDGIHQNNQIPFKIKETSGRYYPLTNILFTHFSIKVIS